MPTVYPITWHDPILLGHYPHMARRDAPVWEQWLRIHALDHYRVAYDVAVGGRLLNIPEASEKELLDWKYLTALRIDALVDVGDSWMIVEVRPDATVSALGAALAYKLIAEREQITDLPLTAAIVCENIQPDVKWACNQLEIGVFVVPHRP